MSNRWIIFSFRRLCYTLILKPFKYKIVVRHINTNYSVTLIMKGYKQHQGWQHKHFYRFQFYIIANFTIVTRFWPYLGCKTLKLNKHYEIMLLGQHAIKIISNYITSTNFQLVLTSIIIGEHTGTTTAVDRCCSSLYCIERTEETSGTRQIMCTPNDDSLLCLAVNNDSF